LALLADTVERLHHLQHVDRAFLLRLAPFIDKQGKDLGRHGVVVVGVIVVFIVLWETIRNMSETITNTIVFYRFWGFAFAFGGFVLAPCGTLGCLGAGRLLLDSRVLG
jgi:hypothetical protein